MSERLVEVLCACSWYGTGRATSACPACGRPHHDRITPVRLAALRAVEQRADKYMPPIMRRRLRMMQLLRLDGFSGVRQLHALTDGGRAVLSAAGARDREAELRRHIVAEAAARHAGLEPAGGS